MKRLFASPEQPHLEVDLLSVYLDRQATAAERARVDSHLSTCAACRAELESLRRTVLLVAALPRMPVPRALTLSQAQVGAGRGRSAARSNWYGGLVRGLGAVTALALVVMVTATFLSRPAWTPGGMLARQAPDQVSTAAAIEAPAEGQGEAAAMQAEAPEAAAPADAATVDEQPAAELAMAPAETPTEEAPAVSAFAATEAIPEPEAPAAAEAGAADAAVPAGSEEAAPAALAQESASAVEAQPLESTPARVGTVQPAAGQPEAAQSEKQPAAEVAPEANGLAVAPTGTEAPAAKSGTAPVFGRGGGGEGMGGAAASAMLSGEALTPEATPPLAQSVSQVLPAGARIAYTDQKSVWAVDRAAGARKLLDAEIAVTPILSSDGTRIAYRVQRDNFAELWSVRWDGSDPRQLLDERTLSKDNLAPDYTERRIQSARWIPGQAALAVNIVAVPVSGALPRTELWRLEVSTGDLVYVTDMGRAYAPLYSPDGTRFALLEYGTETEPQGTLTLFNADGRERRVALSFPASPAKPMYDGQVKWLPNGRGLLVAIPTADPTGPTAVQDMNGATLYRVPVSGEAITAGKVDAYRLAWSPDGTKLAYVRATGDADNTYELYLAAADGASAQLFAPLKEGMFLSWAPDNARFLYQDAYQVFVGQAGRKPQRLGNMVSVVDPRWVSNRQVISRHDTGTDWLLTLRGVDGAAYGLLSLPREAELDVVSR